MLVLASAFALLALAGPGSRRMLPELAGLPLSGWSCVWAGELEAHPSDALQAGRCREPAGAGSEDMAGRLS